MPIWKPEVWLRSGSTGRYADFVRWERDTLQPKYGIPFGVEYTYTLGVAELYDYEWFFAPWTVAVEPDFARRMRMSGTDQRMVYYPRRGFDLWGTRYFILPGIPSATNPDRGIASLLLDADTVYPSPGSFDGPGGEKRREEQLRNEDVQVLRTRNPMPRAWVVHDARYSNEVRGLTRGERSGTMEEMLYAADALWHDESRYLFDPRQIAWIEGVKPPALARFTPGGSTGTAEAVTVRYPDPQHAELDVSLERPGLVILADAYYPGWTLTVDDRPATILRANRMMRGVALDAGKHHLVYEYRPRSFALGKVATLVGFVGLMALGFWSRRSRSS
jgi:hypothetical protein